jgi:hypothetical protein
MNLETYRSCALLKVFLIHALKVPSINISHAKYQFLRVRTHLPYFNESSRQFIPMYAQKT